MGTVHCGNLPGKGPWRILLIQRAALSETYTFQVGWRFVRFPLRKTGWKDNPECFTYSKQRTKQRTKSYCQRTKQGGVGASDPKSGWKDPSPSESVNSPVEWNLLLFLPKGQWSWWMLVLYSDYNRPRASFVAGNSLSDSTEVPWPGPQGLLMPSKALHRARELQGLFGFWSTPVLWRLLQKFMWPLDVWWFCLLFDLKIFAETGTLVCIISPNCTTEPFIVSLHRFKYSGYVLLLIIDLRIISCV